MNITLGFRLQAPQFDPTTGKPKSFENIPVAEAADRISEAKSFRVAHSPDEQEAVDAIVASFQKKYPAFGKLRKEQNEFGCLTIASTGRPDNSLETVRALGLDL